MTEEAESIVFAGEVTEKGHVKPDAVNATRGRLARWKGRRVTVTVKRYVKPKSNPQLALYFAEPDGILSCWADFCGYDRDEMHRELKRAYLAPVLAVSKLTGEEFREMPSLADLNVEEMSAFIERCKREGRQLGIRFREDAA